MRNRKKDLMIFKSLKKRLNFDRLCFAFIVLDHQSGSLLAKTHWAQLVLP